MTSRTVLVTLLVAVISVAGTAAAALPLVREAATVQARESLRNQADLAAEMFAARQGRPGKVKHLGRLMRDSGIRFSLVRDHKADRGWVPDGVLRRLREVRPVHSRETRPGGDDVLYEARPVTSSSGVVLMQPVAEARGEVVGLQLALALAVGAGAGTLAGVLLARRLSRPLRQAARTADRIRQGDRACRMPLLPPAEVGELSSALNELTAALETSEHRQRDFLMSVSHELRTPLTTIRGYAEALADGVLSEDPDTAQDAGRTVLTEAERLDRLVADLLALARLQADDFTLERERVDAVELAAGAATAWRPSLASKGTELRTELPSAAVPLETDPGRIRQVLDILVENAARVAPGAPIVIALAVSSGRPGPSLPAGPSVAPVPAGPSVPSVPADPSVAPAPPAPPAPPVPSSSSYSSSPSELALSVRDGGPGLSDEDLRVAFDRGRLHRRYRDSRPAGTGLGLALAAQLTHRLGGTIEAAHAPEGGACFTVRLPLP